jgi:hypothetical protein
MGPICEWDLPLDFYRWLLTTHINFSHKNNTTNKDNIWKGATMQPIIINQPYPTRNV